MEADVAELLYHIEGCLAMLIGAAGAGTGFLFGKFFFDRCMSWM